MERIDRILKHKAFLYHLGQNEKAESDRIFCRHGMTHFLDVARIGRIISLEEGIALDAEWIYAAALLHDMGKHVQYEDGTPHEIVSAGIAPEILADCGFDDYETGVIIEAILNHRNAEIAGAKDLNGVLYRADKASRACFSCDAEDQCNWKNGKKNFQIKY